MNAEEAKAAAITGGAWSVGGARRQTQEEADAEARWQAQAAESERRHAAHREAIDLRRFGKEVASWSKVQTSVWAHTLDERGAETGYVARVRGRTLAEIRADIWREFEALDSWEDPLNAYTGDVEARAAERKATARPYRSYCLRSFAGEGFSVPSWVEHDGKRGEDIEWPAGVRWIACYAVVGGSEGHWAHVDLVLESDDRASAPTPDDMLRVRTSQSLLDGSARHKRVVRGVEPTVHEDAAFVDGVLAERSRGGPSLASQGKRIVLPAFICKTFEGRADAERIASKFAELLGA